MSQPGSQLEPHINVAPPEAFLTRSMDWVTTAIPASQLEARRWHARKWVGRSERVLFLRLHDGAGNPVAFANVICLGTRLGAMTDEKGVAWLHEMPMDSVQVKVMTTLHGSTIAGIRIRAGELAGLDLQAPPQKKPAPVD